MRKNDRYAVLLVLPLAALACSRAARPPEERLGGGVETQTLAFQSMNASDIDGGVTMTRQGDALMLKLNLEHLTPGDDYPAYVYAGRCGAQGPKLVELGSLLASASGTASSKTRLLAARLRETPVELRHGGLFIQVLHPDETAAACVDLPSEGEPAA